MPYNSKSLIRDGSNQLIPQYFNDTNDQYEVAKGAYGAVFVLPVGFASHVSLETNATTTEQNAPFSVNFVFAITNDGTDSIIINFDASTSSSGAMTLKAGETLSDFPRKCTTIFYKAVSGTQPFRAWGVK